jgi:hypothetical protein
MIFRIAVSVQQYFVMPAANAHGAAQAFDSRGPHRFG